MNPDEEREDDKVGAADKGFWRSKFVTEERYVTATARKWLYISATVLMVAGAICFTVDIVGVLTHSGPAAWDEPLALWLRTLRSPQLTPVMIVLTITFGPIVLPIVIAVITIVWLIFAKHAWRPFLLAGAMVTGVIIANTLAVLVRRERPPAAFMLIGADPTFSFPSGHVLGASDFLIITGFLLVSRKPRAWGIAVALGLAWLGVLSEMFSRMYLGHHWLTDTLASLSISMVIVGAVIAIDTKRTARVRGEKVRGPLSKKQTDGT